MAGFSYATREKRENEIEGVDYHFVSKEEFEAMKERGEFLNTVVANFGNSYGTSRALLD